MRHEHGVHAIMASTSPMAKRHLLHKAVHHRYVHTEAEHKVPVWQRAERTFAWLAKKVLLLMVNEAPLAKMPPPP